jgi:UDP-glucose 4-epimerase
VFGGIRWRDYVGADKANEYIRTQTVPIMLDPHGHPVQRNFVHVEDLVTAIMIAIDHPKAYRQTFNVCMDEPVDYRTMGDYLSANYGLPTIDIRTEFHSTWLDNSKAKFLLGWRPEYDLSKMIDAAWAYQRVEDEPRKIWYPG